jgi:hypothetical protein
VAAYGVTGTGHSKIRDSYITNITDVIAKEWTGAGPAGYRREIRRFCLRLMI